jgi:hypothetical protein
MPAWIGIIVHLRETIFISMIYDLIVSGNGSRRIEKIPDFASGAPTAPGPAIYVILPMLLWPGR